MLSATLMMMAFAMPGASPVWMTSTLILGTQTGGPTTSQGQGAKKGNQKLDKGGGGGYQGPGDQVPPNDGSSGGGNTGGRPPIPTPANPTQARVPSDGQPVPGAPPVTGNDRDRPRTGRDVFQAYNDRFDIWWERNRFALVQFPPLHHGTSVQGRTDTLAPPTEVAALRSDAIELLRPMLHHPQGRVRAAAAIGLGKMRAVASFDDMRGLLEDPESTVRDAACLGLGMLGDPRADHLLLHYLSGTASDSGPDAGIVAYRRGIAAVALSLGGSKTMPRLLLSMGKSDDLPAEIRAFVLSSLAACGDSGFVPDLTPLAEDPSQQMWVRQATYAALGKLGAASAIPTLVRGLRSDVLDVARSSAIGLGLTHVRGDTTLSDLLEQMIIATEDVATRNFATISLGRVGGTAAERALQRVLTRGRQQQVPWAAIALGLSCRADPAPALVEQLDVKLRTSSNVDHRSALCLALGLTGLPQAEASLLAELGSIQPRVQGFAAAALGLLKSGAGSSALAQLAIPAPGTGHTVNPAVAEQVAFAWSIIDDEAALKGLLSLFETETRPEVRLTAARAIGHLGRVEAFSRIRDVLQTSQTDPLRLSEAVTAMATLMSVDRQPALTRAMADTNFADEPPTFRELTAFLW